MEQLILSPYVYEDCLSHHFYASRPVAVEQNVHLCAQNAPQICAVGTDGFCLYIKTWLGLIRLEWTYHC